LTREKLDVLRNFADSIYKKKPDSSKPENEDLKIALNKSELEVLVGIDSVHELEETFAEKYDEILIRRCQAHGKFINFHTDLSSKTM
jgi:hypothetical protein